MANIKIKSSDDIDLLLSNMDDDVCLTVGFFDKSYFCSRTRTSNHPLVSIVVYKVPRGPLCMKLPHHGYFSPCPPLHHFSSSLGLNIVKALKVIRFKKGSKSDLNTIDFDNINVHDVKYLPSYFEGDVLF